MTISEANIRNAYAFAAERYAEFGVDTDKAITQLEKVAISLHCWQGDDVGGFENPGGELGGGLAATGNYPVKPVRLMSCAKTWTWFTVSYPDHTG